MDEKKIDILLENIATMITNFSETTKEIGELKKTVKELQDIILKKNYAIINNIFLTIMEKKIISMQELYNLYPSLAGHSNIAKTLKEKCSERDIKVIKMIKCKGSPVYFFDTTDEKARTYAYVLEFLMDNDIIDLTRHFSEEETDILLQSMPIRFKGIVSKAPNDKLLFLTSRFGRLKKKRI